MTGTTTDRQDTEIALSMLGKQVDRLADKVETLTTLVGNLHADAREALALSYAACDSDVRLAFVLRTILSILDKRSRIFPEDLQFAYIILKADIELREADARIEQSVAGFLAESDSQGAQ